MRQEVYVKFAEALNARRVSHEKVAEAYAEGFCKAAEAMGVDPAALYKQAGLEQLLGRGLTAVRGIAGRAAGAVRSGAGTAGKAIADAGQAAKHRTMPVLKRYLELLGGGNGLTWPYEQAALSRGLFDSVFHKGNPLTRALTQAKIYGSGLRGGFGKDTAAELRKVLAARAGTAAGALGIGAGGAAIANND